MSLSTSTMTLLITAGTVYPDTLSMDVVYTLVVNTTTEFSVSQYTKIPYSTATESFVINGVSTSVQTLTFITGTTLTQYLTALAPISDLVAQARVSDQQEYLASYTGTGTVSVL